MAEKQPWKKPHRHNTNKGRALPQPRKFVESNTDNWREQAACKGMDVSIFFPPAGGEGVKLANRAKKICATCPVTEPCLQYSLDMNDREGVFGGFTGMQRRRFKRI